MMVPQELDGVFHGKSHWNGWFGGTHFSAPISSMSFRHANVGNSSSWKVLKQLAYEVEPAYIYMCVCVCLYIYIYLSIYLYSFRSYIKIHIYIVYPNAPCMVYLPIFRLFLGSMLIHIMINSASPPLCQRPPWTGPLFLRLGVVGRLRPLPKLLPQAKP